MGKRGVVRGLALPRSWQRELALSCAPSVSAPKPELPNQVRLALRARDDSRHTEAADAMRIRRFTFFHGLLHPAAMGEAEIHAFLTPPALKEMVSGSMQKQDLAALLFLERNVLSREVADLGQVNRAGKPKRLPVAPTRKDTEAVLSRLHGDKWLMASLMYGAGLRLEGCLRLRVQGTDFTTNEIAVRDGNGATDRVTLEDGYDIRTVRELLAYKDVRTTTNDTDVLHRGGKGVRNPADSAS
jgi:site-specific recombinase XerD